MAIINRNAQVEQTAKGKRRQKTLEKRLLTMTRAVVAQQAERFKFLASGAAPSEEEEAEMLSQGVGLGVIRMRNTGNAVRRVSNIGSEIGTPDGGRFFRAGGQVSLQEAIISSPVKVTATGMLVTGSTCQYPELNEVTGFSWETKSRGPQSTLPFNRRWAQAVENGGVWDVTPRTIFQLNPEDGILAAEMIKTVPPRGMFRRARAIAGREAGRVLRRETKAILATV